MKKFFKWVGIILGVVILLIGGFALFIQLRGIPKYDIPKYELSVTSSPERVERGKKLVSMLCAGCHLNNESGGLTGNPMDIPQFGDIYSKNITQDKEYGIGNWSDGEIVVLLRTGINPKTGQYIPPWMAKLPHIADEDLMAIIAFLHSDDPIVQAKHVQDKESTPSFLSKFLCFVAFKPFEMPKAEIPMPDTNNMVELGKYYAIYTLDCYTCHSEDFKSIDPLTPEKSGGYFGGGNVLPDASGRMVSTSNITPDKEFGIGNWTEDQFVRALKTGVRPDNTVLRVPMDRYSQLTDKEAAAIYQYLRTVPPLKTPRKPSDSLPPIADANDGKKSYYKYRCYSCHADNGKGKIGDLTKAWQKYPTDSALTAWLKHPEMIKPGTRMPSWDGIIQESEYPGLCSHIRELGKNAGSATVK